LSLSCRLGGVDVVSGDAPDLAATHTSYMHSTPADQGVIAKLDTICGHAAGVMVVCRGAPFASRRCLTQERRIKSLRSKREPIRLRRRGCLKGEPAPMFHGRPGRLISKRCDSGATVSIQALGHLL
jgi:hypothetical protein